MSTAALRGTVPILRAALASVLVLPLATVLCLALATATAPVSAAATTDIKGKVTSGSVGVSGITVTGYAYDSSSASWYQSGDPVKTLGDGSYDVVMSYAGQFRVGFSDATKTYATRYYSASGGSTELNSATTVTAPTTGINVGLLRAGRITGTVTGTGGATLGNVQVTAYQQTSTGWRFATYAYTGADGTYAVAGLQAGSYRLAFHDDTNHFADEYYDNVATLAAAAAIAVTSGADTTGKDAQLAADSHITGTVSTGSTTPLPHIAVQAYAYDAAQGDWDSVGYATTDASGRYDVTGFGPGTYRIGFADPAGTYAPEFYDDVATLDAASDIPVGAQPTSGIDASLGAAAHLTGSLTGVSGTALTGEVVTAYSRSADGSGWTSAATGRAGADGHFDVGGLGPGTYRVGFRDDNGKYAAEFYSDQLDVATAGDVTVAAGQTQSITEKLELGSHLTGTVTDASHAAIGRVVVTAYRFDTTQGSWAPTAYATTSSQGRYDLSGLAAGDYRLGFDGGSPYVAEYWNDRPSLETATSITVDGSTTVSGKDAVLTAAASVTGTVAAGGGPLSGAYVEARGVDASGQPSDVYGFANTGGTGAFTIGGLAPGRYKVLFQDTTGRYLTQYYSAKTSFAAADAISLTTGQRMSGVNAQLVDGAHVTGTMTNASGQALTTGEVTAYASTRPVRPGCRRRTPSPRAPAATTWPGWLRTPTG